MASVVKPIRQLRPGDGGNGGNGGNGNGGNGNGGFSPLSINWHAAFWADDPNWTDPGDGNSVSQWDDGSGNNRHATQATGADQPTFRSSVAAFNSRATVEFVDDHLATASWTALSQPITVVTVAQWDILGGNRGVHDGIISSARNLLYMPSSNVWTMFAGANGPSLSAPVDTAPHLFIATYDLASSSLEVDDLVDTNPSPGDDDLTGLTIGAWHDGTNNFDGHAAFMAVFDGDLPQSDRDDLGTWSTDYYGTP